MNAVAARHVLPLHTPAQTLATIERLRAALAREDIPLAPSAHDEGLQLAIESPTEISLRYESPHECRPTAHRSDTASTALLRSTAIIADLGFAVTLILTPRTQALFITAPTTR